MREKLVVANWKLNGSRTFVESYAPVMDTLGASLTNVKAVICPQHLHIDQLARALAGSSVEVGAQDVSEREQGAYTGEISAATAADLGAKWTIVGHSERRAYHAESSDQVVEKAKRALDSGLTPIYCVGESLEDRASGQTEAFIGRQIKVLIEAFEPLGQLQKLAIAYEPIWAVGTGKTAKPEQAQAVHAYIRGMLPEAGDRVRILYGGSVKPENARELFSQPDIDGGLIGGASLVPEDFVDICQAAEF